MQEIKSQKIAMDEFAIKKLAESFDLPAQDAARCKAVVMRAIQHTGQDRPAVLDEPFQAGHVWLPRLAFAVFASLVLLGGSVIASAKSLPGDRLYPIKQAKENLEFRLASDGQPKAMVLAKHAQERLNELSELKKVLTGDSVQHQAEAKDQASIQVKNAVDSLSRVKLDLEEKGNTQAAAAVNDALSKLVTSAKKSDLEVEDKLGKEDGKEGRNQSNTDKEERERPEGEVKGKWHKPETTDSQTGRKPKNRVIALPALETPTTTATSVAPLLPNDSPHGEVLGTSTQGSLDTGEQSSVRQEDGQQSEVQKKELEQQKHLEEEKNEAEKKATEGHGD